MENLTAPSGATQHRDGLKHRANAGIRSLTPVAELALLRQLSQQLHTAQTAADSTSNRPLDCEAIALLYVQRAATLLEYADYDASVSLPLDVLSSAIDASDQPSTQQQAEADERRAYIMVLAVQQAQEDANKALGLAPGRVEGYFLAAQCFRSSRMLEDADRMISTAMKLLPGNVQIDQLAREIAVERASKRQSTQTQFPTAIITSEALAADMDIHMSRLAISATPEQPLESDNNNESDGPSSRVVWQRISTELEQLRAIADSPELARLESMMHHNVHHQCASLGDARYLDSALKNVISTLLSILRSGRALGLSVDPLPLEEMLKPKLERADWHHLLVQDRAARKWLAHTLVPSTRIALGSLEREPRPGVALLRDGLVLLTRVLLAVGGWRRCTTMPHALAYAELSYDLVKELVSSFSSCAAVSPSTAQGFTRLDMACSNAYGVALRDLLSDFSEALALHQESLETAVLSKDHASELRAHHLVGQTLLRMKEPVLAQAEFMQLLVQSQEEADAAMEALARFELGESCVQRGELDEALVHLRYARTICNQTGNCAGAWRAQSVHHAIAFYSALRPVKRRDAVMCSPALVPKRAESWIEANKLDEPQHDAADWEVQATSVVSKLFASDSSRSSTTVEQEEPAAITTAIATATSKSRRCGGRRDSVFAVAPSALSSRSCSSSSTPTSQLISTPTAIPMDTAASASASSSAFGEVLKSTDKQTMGEEADEEVASHCVIPDQLSEESGASGRYHASL